MWLDALDVLSGAALQAFFERDGPFAAHPGKFAGEEIQDCILTV